MEMLDRSVKAVIGGKEYSLLLTIRATAEITSQYGSVRDMLDHIKNSDTGTGLMAICSLAALLANQSIMQKNYKDGTDIPLLSADEIALFVTPGEIGALSEACLQALIKGQNRHVLPEEDGAANPTEAE